jgi:hypothetical protein
MMRASAVFLREVCFKKGREIIGVRLKKKDEKQLSKTPDAGLEGSLRSLKFYLLV